MNLLSEYNELVSEYELFSFLYDRIVTREISTFAQLKTYCEPIIKDKRTHPVILRLFELVKRLNWGFFATINPVTHHKLWEELVIPDKQFPEAGDIKRTLSISNLYIGMLDIHGYTKFCQDSRKNLSMMHTLDKSINNEIRGICSQCGAVSQRERGDEIVMVAASATDAVTAVLAIMDYYGKTEVVQDPSINTKRSGDAKILPVFKLSAGITGGNTSSPLIITEQGNLAGFLLNCGARLQTRANELSSKESRIMVTKQVYMNYVKENGQNKCALERHNSVYFFDTGLIEFKGVQLPTMEVVFKPEERYKERISESLLKLFSSIKDNLWEQKIYQDLMDLLSRTARLMPKFNASLPKKVMGLSEINNENFVKLCSHSIKTYIVDDDYSGAIDLLHNVIDVIEVIPTFDRLLLDYAKGVAERYDLILDSYRKTVDQEIDDKASRIFQGNYYKAWAAAKNFTATYEKLKVLGRRSRELTNKKVIWYNLIKKYSEEMAFKLYSGKK